MFPPTPREVLVQQEVLDPVESEETARKRFSLQFSGNEMC